MGLVMSMRTRKFGAILFASLCCAMMGNMLLLQPNGGGRPSLSVAPGTSLTLAQARGDGGAISGGVQGSGKVVVLNSYDKQETVRSIQRELTSQGYFPGTVDGMPGLMTRAAIMAFEFDNGLSLKGQADPELLKLLLLGLPQDLPAGDARAGEVVGTEARQVVATIQQTLQQLGYRVGNKSGDFGIETERAIRDFEADQDLRETGRISGRLVSRFVGLADSGRLAMSQ